MFDRIREVIKKMFGQREIKDKLGLDVVMSSDMAAAVKRWSDMYYGKPPWLTKKVHSLNLAPAIAGEHARLATIEMKSEITGSARADYLNAQYAKVISSIRSHTELACAKGGLIIKPFVSGGSILFDYIHADSFFPTAFDSSGNITGAAFVDRKTIGKAWFTRFEIHTLDGTNYTVQNKAYKSNDKAMLGNEIDLASVGGWQSLEPIVTISNISKPLFGYVKMPFANNIDASSPLGVSVYAKAEGLIKQADIQYSRLLWEYESGERKIIASIDALTKKEGLRFKMPDLNDGVFVGLDTKDESFYKEFSPTLRDVSIINGLNDILRKIEFNCGLAYGTISNVQDVDKTATEIKASKQRTYATICDMQKSLQAALEQCIYAMDVYATLYSLAPSGKYETTFEWDDSILVDSEQEFARRVQLVSSGVLSSAELRSWYLGESLEEAEKNLPKAFGDD